MGKKQHAKTMAWQLSCFASAELEKMVEDFIHHVKKK